MNDSLNNSKGNHCKDNSFILQFEWNKNEFNIIKIHSRTHRPATPYLSDYESVDTGVASRSGASTPVPPLKRSNSLNSISGRTVIVANNPLSQSETLKKMSESMGLNGTSIIPVIHVTICFSLILKYLKVDHLF